MNTPDQLQPPAPDLPPVADLIDTDLMQAVPAELRGLGQWVVWRYEARYGRDNNCIQMRQGEKRKMSKNVERFTDKPVQHVEILPLCYVKEKKAKMLLNVARCIHKPVPQGSPLHPEFVGTDAAPTNGLRPVPGRRRAGTGPVGAAGLQGRRKGRAGGSGGPVPAGRRLAGRGRGQEERRA
jgi:hypothetical protein